MRTRSIKEPYFESLDLLEQRGRKAAHWGQSMHPNPRFYKYYWHVFSSSSEYQGKEFFQKCTISTYEAAKEISRLKKSGETFMVFNYSLPRSGPDTPFSPAKSDRWAPPYDEDPDIPYGKEGHK